MPQHKSAKKRLRQSERRRVVNKSVKSNVATQLKAIDKLIKDKKVEDQWQNLSKLCQCCINLPKEDHALEQGIKNYL